MSTDETTSTRERNRGFSGSYTKKIESVMERTGNVDGWRWKLDVLDFMNSELLRFFTGLFDN